MSTTPDRPDLIAAPKSKLPLILGGALVLALVVVGLVVWLGRDDSGNKAGSERPKVVLGVVGKSEPYWAAYEKAVEKAGIDIEIKDFTDYAQPNPALSEGELDVNQFQHIIYLADYNVANKDDLVPLGSTAIYPLGLYSKKYDDVAQIKAGETVIVPDDDTNQARGLLVLQSAGLIKLKGGGSPFSTLVDVDRTASKVKVKAIKADLTPTSLPDVAAAIINNDFVEDSGLSFEDAIAQDDPKDPSSFPYINIFAVRAEDKNNPTLKKLVEIYQDTKSVTDGVIEAAGGTAEIVNVSPAELQKSLDDTEAQIEAAQK